MLLHLKTTRTTDQPPLRVLGYVRDDGFAVEAAVVAACLRRGWELDVLLRDHGDPTHPCLRLAFDRLAAHDASGLVVPGLDHLASTLVDLEPYLDWFLSTNMALVAVAEGLDTSTPAGEATALRLAHLGATERRMADPRRDRTAR